MITEQQLKSDCTPDIIKRMVGLAEGFNITAPTLQDPAQEFGIIYHGNYVWDFIDINDFDLLPLLIHRAVEGWNKKEKSILKEIIVYNDSVKLIEYKESREGGFDPFAIVMKNFENYQPSSLTPCECACLHCLIEVLG